MPPKIIIVGPGGSGKDYLRKKMEKKGYKYGIPYTSRPIRNNEVHGSDYYFLEIPFFEKNNRFFISIQKFNGWYYGISKGEFRSSDLFVMTPSDLKEMTKQNRDKCFVIYLNPPVEIRRKRLLERRDADQVERRIVADSLDFEGFIDYDMVITNPDF